MPNSTMVPHGIRGWASFQVMIPMPGRNISATAASVVDEVSKLVQHALGGPERSSVSEIASSFFSEVFIGPSSASDLRICFAAAGNFLHLGRHHPGHHEIERDRHQDGERRGGDEPFQPGDGLLQRLLDEADRDHVLRGGGLDADVPDAGGLYRRDHQHAGKGALLVDAECRDDAEHDRHQAGDARGGRGHQERHDEADQDRAHHDVTDLGADAGEDSQRDALVEAGRRHGGGDKQRRRHQRQRGIGEAAEGEAEAGAGAQQHLGIGRIGRTARAETPSVRRSPRPRRRSRALRSSRR